MRALDAEVPRIALRRMQEPVQRQLDEPNLYGRDRKAFAQAYCQHVPSVDTPWNLGKLFPQPHFLILLTVYRCHLGKTIVYDTVSNLSWSVDVRTHGIVTVIEKVLGEPWAPSVEIGREVPEAVAEEDCVVCRLVFLGTFV